MLNFLIFIILDGGLEDWELALSCLPFLFVVGFAVTIALLYRSVLYLIISCKTGSYKTYFTILQYVF